MNSKIHYMYRDASNYKNHKTVVVSGEITDEDRTTIAKALSNAVDFIPQQVGLPDAHFENYPLNEDDHCWCELYVNDPSRKDYKPDAEDDIVATDEDPTIDLTARQLVENFRKAAGNWDEVKYAVVI